MTPYSKEQQVGSKKEKDTRPFRQRYGKPLVPKKKYFLKQTPLKRGECKIRPISAKKAKQKADVAAMVAKKIEDTDLICACCGSSGNPLDPSHIVPQWFAPGLAARKDTVNWHCRQPCHDHCENQKWYLMADGLEIMTKCWLIGGKAKEWLRRGLNKEGWGEMNMNLWKMSPFYPDYEKEMENF